MKLKPVLATLALALCSVQAFACYTVFDRNSKVIYKALSTPIDMSMQIKDALVAARFPAGSFMIFDLGNDCPIASVVTALPAPLDASAARPVVSPVAARRTRPGAVDMTPVAPTAPPVTQPVVPVMAGGQSK